MHKTNRVHVRPVHHVAVGEGAVERARAELHHLLVRAYFFAHLILNYFPLEIRSHAYLKKG